MFFSKFKNFMIKGLNLKSKNYRNNREITIPEANNLIATQNNIVLIDVRSNQEYQEYHINGAICVPYYEIARKIDKVVPNKNSIIILYCQSGVRSKKALEILMKKGYENVYNIKNGLDGNVID